MGYPTTCAGAAALEAACESLKRRLHRSFMPPSRLNGGGSENSWCAVAFSARLAGLFGNDITIGCCCITARCTFSSRGTQPQPAHAGVEEPPGHRGELVEDVARLLLVAGLVDHHVEVANARVLAEHLDGGVRVGERGRLGG